jgi:hypothetical protein
LFQFLYAYSRGGLVNKVYALSFKSWCSGVVRRNPWPPGRIWIHFDRNFLELLLEDKQKIKKKGMSANWGRPPTSCRCSGYRGIPAHLLLGPVIGPSSAQGRINDPRYGEDPHEEAPREENDGGNC